MSISLQVAAKTTVRLLAFGTFFAYLGFRNLKEERRLIEMPFSKARSLSVGPVRLQGRLISDNHWKSSFDAVEVGPFKILEVAIPGLKFLGNRHYLMTLGMWEDLYLDDGTGKVRIDPEGVEVRLKPVFTYKKYFYQRLSPRVEPTLTSAGFEDRRKFLGIKLPIRRDLRVSEYIVQEGEIVECFGYAEPDDVTQEMVVRGKAGSYVIQTPGRKARPLLSILYFLAGCALISMALGIIIAALLSVTSTLAILGVFFAIALLSYFYFKSLV